MLEPHLQNNWVLGLTGGIGAGKSTLSRAFAALGVPVMDADIVAREQVAPGSIGLEAIVEHFGKGILHDDGSLDRAQLRHLVFSDAEHKKWLDTLLHPLIRQSMLKQLSQAQGPYVILEAPLLFENNLEKYCHRTLLVDVPEEVQIARTTERDNTSAEQTKRIIKAQMSRLDKRTHADDIIDNTQPLERVFERVDALHKEYLRLAKLHLA